MKNKRISLFVIIILILALNASYIVYGQLNDKEQKNKETIYNISINDDNEEIYIDDLHGEMFELSTIIDDKIDAYQILVGELEKKKEVLKELDRIKTYISFDMESDLTQVLDIQKKTPLDLEGAAIVVEYSKKLNLKPSLILGLIKLESNFKKYEVGVDNDRGYMQIIPQTEKWLARKYGSRLGLKYDPKRIFDPEYNIGLGAIYLKVLKDAYGDDTERILSEYNRGPYNLKAYYEKHNTYSTSYSRGVLSREKKFTHLN